MDNEKSTCAFCMRSPKNCLEQLKEREKLIVQNKRLRLENRKLNKLSEAWMADYDKMVSKYEPSVITEF